MFAKVRAILFVSTAFGCIAAGTSRVAAQDNAAPRVDAFGVPLPNGAIARIGYDGVMRHGDLSDHSLVVSDDGKLAATAGWRDGDRDYLTHAIWIWDLPGKKRLREIPAEGGVSVHFFTPDGRRLLGMIDRKFALWDVATGAVLWRSEFEGRLERVWRNSPATHAVVFHSEYGERGTDRRPHSTEWKLLKIDLASGKTDFEWLIGTTRLDISAEKSEAARVIVDFAPEAARFAIGFFGGEKSGPVQVRFHNARDKTLLRKIEIPTRSLFDCRLTPDGERAIVSGWWTEKCWLVNAQTGNVREVAGIPKPYWLGWLDDKHLAVNETQGVVLWDVDAGKGRRISTALDRADRYSRPIAAFSRDRKTLVTNDQMLQVWDVATGKNRIPEWQPLLVSDLRFGATTLSAGSQHVWDRATWKRYDRPFGIDESKGTFLATVGDGIGLYKDTEDRLTFFDIRTGAILRRGSEKLSRNGENPYSTFVAADDGKRVCHGWDDRAGRYEPGIWKFQVFDVADGRQRCTGTGNPIAMSSDHVIIERVDLPRYPRPLFLFDIRKKAQLSEVKELPRYGQFRFSPDSKKMLFVQRHEKGNATLRLWNVDPWQLAVAKELPADDASVSWSPDSRMIVVAVAGRHVELLDAGTLRTLATLKPPIEGPIAFSPDGKQLATAGANSVTIWDFAKCVVVADRK